MNDESLLQIMCDIWIETGHLMGCIFRLPENEDLITDVRDHIHSLRDALGRLLEQVEDDFGA